MTGQNNGFFEPASLSHTDSHVDTKTDTRKRVGWEAGALQSPNLLRTPFSILFVLPLFNRLPTAEQM